MDRMMFWSNKNNPGKQSLYGSCWIVHFFSDTYVSYFRGSERLNGREEFWVFDACYYFGCSSIDGKWLYILYYMKYVKDLCWIRNCCWMNCLETANAMLYGESIWSGNDCRTLMHLTLHSSFHWKCIYTVNRF